MATSTKIQASAPASAVRAWLVETGQIDASQKRGKFSVEQIASYNSKHGLKYRQGQFVSTVTVSAKPAKGRTVTRKVNVEQVRAWAIEQGIEVGARGRLSQDVLAAFVLA